MEKGTSGGQSDQVPGATLEMPRREYTNPSQQEPSHHHLKEDAPNLNKQLRDSGADKCEGGAQRRLAVILLPRYLCCAGGFLPVLTRNAAGGNKALSLRQIAGRACFPLSKHRITFKDLAAPRTSQGRVQE